MSFGTRLAQRLKELHLTQMQVAEKTGLTQQAISRYVRDRSKPTYEGIVALSEILSVHPSWFFQESHPDPFLSQRAIPSPVGLDVIAFPQSGKAPQHKTFVIGHWFPMQNVPPPGPFIIGGILKNFYALIFNQLAQTVFIGQPRGVLAIDWKTVGESWVFQLREGVRFHDGSPLTAVDVAWSYQQYLQHNRQERRIASVEILDENFVQLHLKSQCRIEEVAMPPILPFGAGNPPHQFIGTGPFQVAELNPGLWKLRRNPNFFFSGPYFDEVHIREYPTPQDLEEALKADEVHFAIGVASPSESHVVRGESTAPLRYHLHFMLDEPLVQNPLVRKAIALGLDREALATATGFTEPLYSSGAFDYILDDRLKKPPLPDIETARLLLKQVPDIQNEVFRLKFYPTAPQDKYLAEAILEQLKRIGIPAIIGESPHALLLIRSAEPLEAEYAMWKSSTVQNINNYKNVEVDERIQRLQDNSATDSQLLELRRLIQKDIPDLPLMYLEIQLAYVKTLRALENHIILLRGLADIHNWYLDFPTEAESKQAQEANG